MIRGTIIALAFLSSCVMGADASSIDGIEATPVVPSCRVSGHITPNAILCRVKAFCLVERVRIITAAFDGDVMVSGGANFVGCNNEIALAVFLPSFPSRPSLQSSFVDPPTGSVVSCDVTLDLP